MIELKPCPFCGGEAKFIDDDYSYVICTNCKIHPYRRISNLEAIEAWNNRPNPWHTGKPTEEGLFYAVICKGWERPYNRLAFVKNGKIYCLDDAGDCEDFLHEIVKYREVWQFKGNQEKSEEISPNSKASNWTVKELMEKLKVVPEDAQVYICSEDCGWEYPATGFGINYNGDRTEVVIY